MIMDLDIHVVVLVVWLSIGISTASVLDSSALLVKARGGGGGGLGIGSHVDHNFLCLTSQCFHDEVCRLYNTNGHLSGHCIQEHDVPHNADHDGCPQLLGEGSECFCNNHNCGHHTQAATGQHTITTTSHNDLVCDHHVCHGHQYCIIEERHSDSLRLKCADVNNTHHCLPNLLSLGSSCFCDTRTCVDHTLISIVAGHQVAGLICSNHHYDVCHADMVCEIQMYHFGLRKHCGHGYHMTLCTQLLKVNQRCYCTTQECIFGQNHAPTTISRTYKPTPARPTVFASTTLQQTTDHLTTGQRKTAAATTTDMNAITSVSASTVNLANPPTILANTSIPTKAVLKGSTRLTHNACSDDEDSNFSCIMYEKMYSLCAATTGTLYRIAHKRCQAYCGICSESSTSRPQSASLPKQPTCIDHDARCSQFQFHICSSNVSQNFVISICPKSCNKCAEYLASLNPQPVTTTAQPVINTAQPVTTKAQQVTATANPITTTPKPVTKTAAPTTTAQSVTTATVVCQDKPGVDCKLFNIDFCANPYSNTICAKSCGHCTRVIQSAFG